MTLLRLEMEADLDSLSFHVEDRHLGSIERPRLLWECSCHVEDGGRSPERGRCAVHSLPGAHEIASLFGRGTAINYRGITVHWDAKLGWPPSIDSFFLACVLQRNGWPGTEIRRLWDIGAGTGFLGLQGAASSAQLEELILVEPGPAAALARRNAENLREPRPLVRVRTVSGLALGTPDFRVRDAVIANPPYLPVGPPLHHQPGGPARGTALLQHLIALAAGAMIPVALVYSGLAQPEVEAAARSAGAEPPRIVDERRVPFRLPLEPSHRDWLVRERGLEIDPDDVFEFQHRIRVAIVSTSRG